MILYSVLIFLILNALYFVYEKLLRSKMNNNLTLQYAKCSRFRPKNIEELQKIIKKYRHIRVLGAKCGWNFLVNTNEGDHSAFVDMSEWNKIKMIDDEIVEAEAGVTFSDLIDFLKTRKKELALSFRETFQVGGLISAGSLSVTSKESLLSDLMTEITVINGKGEIKTILADDPSFKHYRVNLGALGIILRAKFKATDYMEYNEQQLLVRDNLRNLKENQIQEKFKTFSVLFSEKNFEKMYSILTIENNKLSELGYHLNFQKKRQYPNRLMYIINKLVAVFILPTFTLIYFHLLSRRVRCYFSNILCDIGMQSFYKHNTNPSVNYKYDLSDISFHFIHEYKYYNLSMVFPKKVFSEVSKEVLDYLQLQKELDFSTFYLHGFRFYHTKHTSSYYPWNDFFSLEIHFSRNNTEEQINGIAKGLHEILKKYHYRIHPGKYTPQCIWGDKSYFDATYATKEMKEFKELILQEDPELKFQNDYTKLIFQIF